MPAKNAGNLRARFENMAKQNEEEAKRKAEEERKKREEKGKVFVVQYFNRSSRRKRGMTSNPLFIIPSFFLHFPNELCYGYLR